VLASLCWCVVMLALGVPMAIRAFRRRTVD